MQSWFRLGDGLRVGGEGEWEEKPQTGYLSEPALPKQLTNIPVTNIQTSTQWQGVKKVNMLGQFLPI